MQPSFKKWHLDNVDIVKSAQWSGFLDELSSIDKEAGVLDALRTAVTGRVPLYHGTTADIGRRAMTEGLRPQATKGVSDLLGLSKGEKGLSFLTRVPKEAKHYAKQAVGIRRAKKMKALLGKHAPEVVKKLKEKVPEEVRPVVELSGARILGSLPGGGKKILKAQIPRNVLRSSEGGIPELAGPRLALQREALSVQHPWMEQLVTGPFLRSTSMKGGVPAKFIKGSPQYQRVSLREIAENLKRARKKPKEYGKDVLRSLTDVSHRPSTMLQMAGKPF